MPGGGIRAATVHGWAGEALPRPHTQADGGAGEGLVPEQADQVAQAPPGTHATTTRSDTTDSAAGLGDPGQPGVRGCQSSPLGVHGSHNRMQCSLAQSAGGRQRR